MPPNRWSCEGPTVQRLGVIVRKQGGAYEPGMFAGLSS